MNIGTLQFITVGIFFAAIALMSLSGAQDACEANSTASKETCFTTINR